MSKGGAGKVYFVLYLAVILELLIIIVERDEAEEGLMKKQKESMRIVESILTQLQSGAGTEGINTRPQDAIVLSEKFPAEQQKYFKKFRTYYIEVGVTDVSSALNMDGMEESEKKERVETLKKLANVQELQYEVYYHPSTEVDVPPSPPQSEFKKVELNPVAGTKLANDANAISSETWEMQATRRLDLNASAMKDYAMPVYTESQIKTGDINTFAPADSVRTNRVFSYSEDKTERLKIANGSKTTKRAFVVNFQPPSKPGWYKLRFSSRTNRIMGISAEQNIATLKDDAKVNIGTVQLKVKDLRSVQSQLAEQLSGTGVPSAERFAAGDITVENFDKDLNTAKETILQSKDENKSEKASRVDLYRYIAKLLSPGKYTSFDQNRGSIEIDISVQQPTIEQEAPIVTWDDNGELFTFDKASKVVATFNSNLFDKATPTVFFNGKNYTPTKLDVGAVGKSGKWKIELPGNLSPKIYDVIASLNSSGGTDFDTLKLQVFPAGLAVLSSDNKSGEADAEVEVNDLNATLEEDIKGFGKGEKLDFTATPSSKNIIPGSQFRTKIIGTTVTSNDPKIGFSIRSADGYEIPFESDKIAVQVYWQDPKDQGNKVQIFPLDKEYFEFTPELPRPIIKIKPVGPIADRKNPIITLVADIIAVPKTRVSDETFSILDFKMQGYKAVLSGTFKQSGNTYSQDVKIIGKLPLKPSVTGVITFDVKAKTLSPNGDRSKDRIKKQTFQVTN